MICVTPRKFGLLPVLSVPFFLLWGIPSILSLSSPAQTPPLSNSFDDLLLETKAQGKSWGNDPTVAPRLETCHLFPEWIQHLRVLADGTQVICTLGDPESREGRDPQAPRVWIRGETMAEAHGLHPVPTCIDSRGRAWFEHLYPPNQTHWHATDGTRDWNIAAQSRVLGRPIEDKHGGIWLPETRGLQRLQSSHLDKEVDSDRLDAILLPAISPSPLSWSYSEHVQGAVTVVPRWNPSPNAVGQAHDWHGSIFFSAGPEAPLQRIDHKSYRSLQSLTPLRKTEWLGLGLQPRWRWQPPGETMPKDVTTLLLDLGSEHPARRQEAEEALLTVLPRWGERIEFVAEHLADPEIRHRVTQLLQDHICANPLPGNWSDAHWPAASCIQTLRDIEANTGYLAIPFPYTNETTRATFEPPYALARQTPGNDLELLITNIPAAFRPTTRMEWDPIEAVDILHLGTLNQRESWAWIDPIGRLQIMSRDGMRLDLPPLPFAPPTNGVTAVERTPYDFPYPALLGLHDDLLIFRAHGRVIAWHRNDLAGVPAVPCTRDQLTARKTQLELKRLQNQDDGFEEGICALLQNAPSASAAWALLADYGYYLESEGGWCGSECALRLRGVFSRPGTRKPDADQPLAWIHESLSDNLENRQALQALRHANFEIRLQKDPFQKENDLDSAYLNRGLILSKLEKWDASVNDYRLAILADGMNDTAWNNLAWVMAAAPDPAVRNGKLAIRYATTACEFDDFDASHSIDTLAAAYAEAGNFKKAIEWQKKAIELSGNDDEDDIYHRHLRKFQAGEPLRLPEADE